MKNIWLSALGMGVCVAAAMLLHVERTFAAEAGHRPHVVLLSYEEEYHAAETLPVFAKYLTAHYGCRCTMLLGEEGRGVPGLDALADADVLVLFARRHALPKAQMAALRRYLDRGGPLVALRTASHAFAIKDAPPQGFATWPEFDHEVLGGNYHNHLRPTGRTKIVADDKATQHPILAGVDRRGWTTSSSLYLTSPLAAGTTLLLWGEHEKTKEPLAWTASYHGGRVFYAAIGNPEDFQSAPFRTMLVNAIFWAMDKPVPPRQ